MKNESMNNDNISTETIKKNINDSKIAIIKMIRRERGLRIIGDFSSIMFANAYVVAINDLKKFIGQLNKILKERKNEKGMKFELPVECTCDKEIEEHSCSVQYELNSNDGYLCVCCPSCELVCI